MAEKRTNNFIIINTLSVSIFNSRVELSFSATSALCHYVDVAYGCLDWETKIGCYIVAVPQVIYIKFRFYTISIIIMY